jgi:V/A-type H+/Na+-transporting ATPase subunit G/H
VSIEILKLIKEAEDKAELIKKEAAQQSKQITTNANVETSRILEEAVAKAESNRLDVIKNAESEAQLIYEQIIKKAEIKCNDIIKSAESNMDKAVSIILERIVKTNGNS